jgi:hypothetical protein
MKVSDFPLGITLAMLGCAEKPTAPSLLTCARSLLCHSEQSEESLILFSGFFTSQTPFRMTPNVPKVPWIPTIAYRVIVPRFFDLPTESLH